VGGGEVRDLDCCGPTPKEVKFFVGISIYVCTNVGNNLIYLKIDDVRNIVATFFY
jgi:hypothetical protein